MIEKYCSFYIIFPLILFISCVQPRPIPQKVSNIGYVNLQLLVDYISRSDKDALRLQKDKKDLEKKKEKFRKMAAEAANDTERLKALEELDKNNVKLERITVREDLIKQRIYRLINKAVKNVADRSGIEFVFNLGDALLYSKTDVDLTEEVFREILVIQKRNDPISR